MVSNSAMETDVDVEDREVVKVRPHPFIIMGSFADFESNDAEAIVNSEFSGERR